MPLCMNTKISDVFKICFYNIKGILDIFFLQLDAGQAAIDAIFDYSEESWALELFVKLCVRFFFHFIINCYQ